MTQRTIRKIKQNIAGHLFILPVILGVAIFTLAPVIYAFVCSFYEIPITKFTFNLGRYGEFIGLKNYGKMFTVYTYRKEFLQSFKVTFTYAVIFIPLMLVCSFALALLLNQKIKGMRIFRTILYLPCLIPAVCSGLLWSRITDPDKGVLNNLFQSIGLPKFAWFTEASTSMPAFIFISMFGIGGNMILWLAQLKNVPQSVYESARLDGASRARQLFQITIPLCTPMILYNTIMSVIAVMQTYAQVVTLTGGGGVDMSLYFVVHGIYGNRVNHFGYACALSFMLFIIIALLTLVTMKTSKWVYYGEEG